MMNFGFETLECLLIQAEILGDGESWGTYHYCGAPITTWCKFARAIVEAASPRRGKTIPVHAITTADYPLPARRPANSALDCSTIAAIFGLAQPEWADGVTQCVANLLARDNVT